MSLHQLSAAPAGKSLGDIVLGEGERKTFDHLAGVLRDVPGIDPFEVAGLAVLGLRYTAIGAKPYTPTGKQFDHSRDLDARDLLKLCEQRRKANNWWDSRRIDAAVSTLFNVGLIDSEVYDSHFQREPKAAVR